MTAYITLRSRNETQNTRLEHCRTEFRDLTFGDGGFFLVANAMLCWLNCSWSSSWDTPPFQLSRRLDHNTFGTIHIHQSGWPTLRHGGQILQEFSTCRFYTFNSGCFFSGDQHHEETSHRLASMDELALVHWSSRQSKSRLAR